MQIKVLYNKAYIGVNRYCDWAALHTCVQAIEQADQWEGVCKNLSAALAELLPAHTMQSQTIRAWVMRCEQNTYSAADSGLRAVTSLAIAIQNLAGADLSLDDACIKCEGENYHLLYAYQTQMVGFRAMEISLAVAMLAMQLTYGKDVEDVIANTRTAMNDFLRNAPSYHLDQTTRALTQAARQRGIPVFRINESARYIRLGHGRFQRKIMETFTSNTSKIGYELSRNKQICNSLLREMGVPTPQQIAVFDWPHASDAARQLGYPLVVKPSHGGKGMGVTPNIRTEEELKSALMRAQEANRGGVLLEKFIAGSEYRLLVVKDKLLAAARRDPASVTGDGHSTINALVDTTNQDERRGAGFEKLLNRIVLDEETDRILMTQGLSRDSIPPLGQTVTLRQTANISTGGIGVDVTDLVHPDVVELAELTARVLDLDIAGIDYISPDISRPWKEVGGAVIEANACPGLRPHWSADGGRRDVVGPILDALLPPDRPYRIPAAAITGSVGKTTTCRMLSHILMSNDYTVGLTCTDGIYVQGRLRRAGDLSGGRACQHLLGQPDIDVAVLEIARGGLLKQGVGIDQCDVAALIGLDSEHIGQDGIETLEQMAELKSLLLKTASKAVVLNADDPLCLKAEAVAPPQCSVVWFSENANNQKLIEHCSQGGVAITVSTDQDGKTIVICTGPAENRVLPLADIPAYAGGSMPHNVRNALAATAAAFAMGIEPDVIATALSTFKPNLENNPGRLSWFDELPFPVIIDLPVNRTTVNALGEVVRQKDCTGQRILAMTAAGNRPDSHFVEMAQAVAPYFDQFVLFSWDDPRGRDANELPSIFAHALAGAGVEQPAIHIVPDQALAYSRALGMATADDLVVLHCPDNGVRRDALIHLLRQAPDFPASTYRDYLRESSQNK